MADVKLVDKIVKIILLSNGDTIISQIDEVTSEIGEPDCKLVEPFTINKDGTLSPWLMEYTTQNTFMISSDKILTLSEPNTKLSNLYNDIIK